MAHCWAATPGTRGMHLWKCWGPVPVAHGWRLDKSIRALAPLASQLGCTVQTFDVQPCPLCWCLPCILHLSQSSPVPALPSLLRLRHQAQAPFALAVPLGSPCTPLFLPAPARGALHILHTMAGLTFLTFGTLSFQDKDSQPS